MSIRNFSEELSFRDNGLALLGSGALLAMGASELVAGALIGLGVLALYATPALIVFGASLAAIGVGFLVTDYLIHEDRGNYVGGHSYGSRPSPSHATREPHSPVGRHSPVAQGFVTVGQHRQSENSNGNDGAMREDGESKRHCASMGARG